MSKYFNAHIHSSDAEVRVKARAEYLKAQLLTQLMWSSSTAKQYLRYNETLRAVVCKIRAILKRHCHTISPNWLKIGM